jgi:hypothetical protein
MITFLDIFVTHWLKLPAVKGRHRCAPRSNHQCCFHESAAVSRRSPPATGASAPGPKQHSVHRRPRRLSPLCSGYALLVTPQPHLLSAPSRLRCRSGWARQNADCRSPQAVVDDSVGSVRRRRVDVVTAKAGQSRRRIRAPRTRSWSQALIRQPHRLRLAHSQHTSEVHLPAVSIGEFRSFPCKRRTLPDATGLLSALSGRKPGFDPRNGTASRRVGHAVRNASVGLRRAAFIAGYRPAIAPMRSPAAGAVISAYPGTTNGSCLAWA